MLLPSVVKSLDDLLALLGQLTDAEYSKPCPALSNATIGQHTRHIIEMFRCLLDHYESGIVDYDKRERNITIETNTGYAIAIIAAVREELDKPDKKLTLSQFVDGREIRIESNYNRELLYNLEHCIHHQALIKVALHQCDGVTVDENFGVARSTIEYRNQCAQ